MTHKIVFVSKDTSFQSPNMHDIPDIGLEFSYIKNNKLPLGVVYNQIIEQNNSYDFLYLVHADVSLDFAQLIKHVENVREKYDIIGLCGCQKISISQSPLNWFCGSIPYPETRWGCVTHGELGNKCSFFSQHHPDILDQQVACIDGLCIILSKTAIASGIRFDETLGSYDMYDTDLSFQAIMKYNLRLGVIVRKDLQHYSVGKSIISENFLRVEKKFRQKWGFEIPQNSPIKKLI